MHLRAHKTPEECQEALGDPPAHIPQVDRCVPCISLHLRRQIVAPPLTDTRRASTRRILRPRTRVSATVHEYDRCRHAPFRRDTNGLGQEKQPMIQRIPQRPYATTVPISPLSPAPSLLCNILPYRWWSWVTRMPLAQASSPHSAAPANVVNALADRRMADASRDPRARRRGVPYRPPSFLFFQTSSRKPHRSSSSSLSPQVLAMPTQYHAAPATPNSAPNHPSRVPAALSEFTTSVRQAARPAHVRTPRCSLRIGSLTGRRPPRLVRPPCGYEPSAGLQQQ
ncbi:hypothetical protein C8Q73DRAFT_206631 [Cubamyces lactineus]|nr:hypothetical protein C8Q73DRAFT_206631 [Cubamyces lactineus]